MDIKTEYENFIKKRQKEDMQIYISRLEDIIRKYSIYPEERIKQAKEGLNRLELQAIQVE